MLLLLAAVGFLCWRAPYGFGLEDESNYVSYAHRFAMGDSMLTEDWSVIQMFSVLTYLPAKIYLAIIGSSEGIILFFRYLYILVQTAISGAIYCRFRTYGPASIPAFLIYILYVPVFIMNLSYLSLTTALAVLIGLMLSRGNQSRGGFLITGILFACLVLCNPFFATVYFAYCLFLIVVKIIRQKKPQFFSAGVDYLSTDTWLWLTFGIALVALILISFVLSGTTIKEVLTNLPHIFSDSEYVLLNTEGESQNMFSLQETLRGIININRYLFIAFSILLSVITLDKKRIKHRKYYLIVGVIVVLAYIADLGYSSNLFKYSLCMFPLSLLGLICYILSNNKNKRLFLFLWVWGILVAFFQDVATDEEGFYSMSMGLVVSVLASIIFFENIVREILDNNEKEEKSDEIKTKQKKNAFAILLSTVFLVQVGFEAFILADFKSVCAEYLFSDNFGFEFVNEPLDRKIHTGPAKGLMTTKTTAKHYGDIVSDLSGITESGEGPLLITAKYPWGYIYAGMPYATYSTWFLQENLPETEARLSKYYRLHPDRKPEYIYVPRKADLFIVDDYIKNRDIKYADAILAYIENKYDCSISNGKAGYIVEVFADK